MLTWAGCVLAPLPSPGQTLQYRHHHPCRSFSVERHENHTTKASYYSRRVQILIKPTLESHSSNVELKSHTLQLDPNRLALHTDRELVQDEFSRSNSRCLASLFPSLGKRHLSLAADDSIATMAACCKGWQ
ncbi:hypothetical protein CR513_38109, partial [Mucuna pruriens]